MSKKGTKGSKKQKTETHTETHYDPSIDIIRVLASTYNIRQDSFREGEEYYALYEEKTSPYMCRVVEANSYQRLAYHLVKEVDSSINYDRKEEDIDVGGKDYTVVPFKGSKVDKALRNSPKKGGHHVMMHIDMSAYLTRHLVLLKVKEGENAGSITILSKVESLLDVIASMINESKQQIIDNFEAEKIKCDNLAVLRAEAMRKKYIVGGGKKGKRTRRGSKKSKSRKRR